jgi:cystathionine beta-synthase
MVGAIQAAKRLKKGQRCVVLLADSIRNYMTKHLSETWMKDHGFTDDKSVKEEETKTLQWGGATIKVGSYIYYHLKSTFFKFVDCM